MKARWLAPLVAAVVVVALVAVFWQWAGSRRSAGPDPGPAAPTSPTTPAGTVVHIAGYTTHGRVLRLHYATGLPECYGHLDTPEVDEGRHSVTVTLRLRPPDGRGSTVSACPDIAVVRSVAVTLERPLGSRVVRDGGNRGAVVPAGNPLAPPSPLG